ncbi:hypothetical protein FY528_16810 [Hymenobacter lutimineralis]|uniref:Uncharacterized protein n=2 Tax=Hymenobacter TaxID=89966 RepID=A0A5D6UT94_9BACT|nr:MULTISPECIES: DUF6252 family protein [Hymenobacter]MBG8554120.1 hypothetical protein [Hymenobacter guriensis]QIX62273.1 hypothetical protein HER32_14230 [Hymenobacter sp. BT18]TYZ06931.1 hypothetical protein FY528_16810 [Hymenobacter lutimineralis]
MKTTSFLFRPLLLACSFLLLSGCGKDDEEDAAPDSDGTVTWTRNGKTITSTIYSGAFYDDNMYVKDVMKISASQNINEETLSLAIDGLDAKGVGTYELKKSSAQDDGSVGAIVVGNGQTGALYNTLSASGSVNGTIKVTAYDKATQKLEGTFSFTAGAVPFGNGTGTQTITNGTFSFHRFR